jgi:CheY-like chemotaxis protein
MATEGIHAIGNGAPIAVLVVDDDSEFLFVARQELIDAGFLVRCASGGLQAVFAADQDAPDAVVCDVRMPGLGGLSVAEALREREETRTIPLVACTADPHFSERAPFYGLFDAVVAKPVDWPALAFLIRHQVEARRSSAVYDPSAAT